MWASLSDPSDRPRLPPHPRPPTLPPTPQECCSDLAALQRLHRLEALDLGWCSSVGDADAAALAGFERLRDLNLARTQVGG